MRVRKVDLKFSLRLGGGIVMKIKQIIVFAMLLASLPAIIRAEPPTTQAVQADYEATITARAEKIVAGLNLSDADRGRRVAETIKHFYRTLRDWQDQHAADRKTLRNDPTQAGKTKAAALEASLAGVRQTFVDALATDLDASQIAAVKDGLTYNVLNVTMKRYREMLPDLTAEQDAQLLAWLTEARELAISEGTSEAKHGVFGKYKGRINNYLAKAGINMKEAEKRLQQRTKDATSSATKPS